MRKVLVKIEFNLLLIADEDQEISDFIDEMDYNFSDTTGNVDIIDETIEDYEILDSK